MRAWRVVSLCCGWLLGCHDELQEVKSFVQQTQAAYPPRTEPLPNMPVFHHVPYSAQTQRSPFLQLEPTAVEAQAPLRQGCLMPNKTREREPLERYALDSLSMRGTIGRTENLHALLQASDGKLFRVGKNHYVGLFYGRVVQVKAHQITIEELVPDESNCWAKRITQLELTAG